MCDQYHIPGKPFKGNPAILRRGRRSSGALTAIAEFLGEVRAIQDPDVYRCDLRKSSTPECAGLVAVISADMAGGANLTAAIARDHACAIHKENDRSRTNLARSNRVAMDADNDHSDAPAERLPLEGSRNRAMSLWTVRSMKRYGDNDDSKSGFIEGLKGAIRCSLTQNWAGSGEAPCYKRSGASLIMSARKNITIGAPPFCFRRKYCIRSKSDWIEPRTPMRWRSPCRQGGES